MHSTRYSPATTAVTLADLDAKMRRPDQSMRAGVTARFRFYETAIRLYAVHRLNELAGLVPRQARTLLSERSIDVIFEDSRYSEAVVAQVVALADRDPDFRQAMDAQEGPSLLHLWRTKAKQPDLFAFAA